MDRERVKRAFRAVAASFAALVIPRLCTTGWIQIVITVIMAVLAIVGGILALCLPPIDPEDRKEPFDWRSVRWWELKGIPERIAALLVELEENENFLARLRNCNTEADLKNLVSVQWSSYSQEDRATDLSFLMDGERDREDWIGRTVEHHHDLLSSLLDETEKFALWHGQNATKRTRNE